MGQQVARAGDTTVHGGVITSPGCPTVFIGSQPAARIGDIATCTGPPDSISTGCPTVLIDG